MMKRTFRRAGGMASKMKNKEGFLKKTTKAVGKLASPGAAVIGNLKDIRDRKSILNKRTPIKKDTRPNRDISSLREKAKKNNQSPQGTIKPSRPRLDKSTIEKMNKARDNYYKKNTKRIQYLGNKKG